MQGRKWLWLLLIVAGCREGPNADAPPEFPIESFGNAFDAATAGAIQGKVLWKGPLPNVRPFEVHAYHDYLNAGRLRGEHPNPHAPMIDTESHGIAEVLIRLDGIKCAQSKPWAHKPVSVEMQADGIPVCQGDDRRRIGVVQRGAEVAFINRDPEFHTLRARGAAFLSLPFVVADQPILRRLDKSGFVDLSEGGGAYWRRAYLVVMDHPYAVLTDKTGHFSVDGVPAGAYRLTAWLPNWHIESREREPETAII